MFKLIILSFAILVVSCGGGSSSQDNAEIDISGVWSIYCHLGRDEVYEIDEVSIHVTVTEYVDPQCEQVSNIRESPGIYAIGEDVLLSNSLRAHEIDIFWDNPEFGEEVLQIVYRESDNLYFGVFNENTRPEEIDFSVPLLLQE